MTGAERGKIRAVPRKVFSKTPSLSLRLKVRADPRCRASVRFTFGRCSATVRLFVRLAFGFRSVHVGFGNQYLSTVLMAMGPLDE